MSAPREGPNPLRPYYIPPSVGPSHKSTPTVSANATTRNTSTSAAAKASFGSSARDILSDLDYGEYLSDGTPSAADIFKRLLDQAAWKYTTVLLAQPFEVAKTVLQVQNARHGQERSPRGALHDDMRRRPGRHRAEQYGYTSSDDSDSPSYFTSSAPLTHTPSRSPRRRGRRRNHDYHLSRTPSPPPPQPHSSHLPSPQPHRLNHTNSLTTVLSHLWTTEGTWGLYKGTNSTFIYTVLVTTSTSFIRSLLCALLALPDPGFSPSAVPTTSGGLDVLSSPLPLASLFAAVGAVGIAGMLLAPIDIARTRLLLTPTTHPPRSLLKVVQQLRSWTVPFSIAPVTLLHSTLPTFISAATPLLLRSRLGIDAVLTPTTYTIATFVSQVIELGVRLPLETVLRRGQMDVAVTATMRSSRTPTTSSSQLRTIVEVGAYKGLVGTIYHIAFEEGVDGNSGAAAEVVRSSDGAPAVKTVGSKSERQRKGQGVQGLYRGWRVGMWGLVGVWGAASLGRVGGKGAEF